MILREVITSAKNQQEKNFRNFCLKPAQKNFLSFEYSCRQAWWDISIDLFNNLIFPSASLDHRCRRSTTRPAVIEKIVSLISITTVGATRSHECRSVPATS